MKKFSFLFFLLLNLSLGGQANAKIEAVLGSIPLENNQNLAMMPPETDASEIIISRQQYVISYNKNRRSPNWTAWKLDLDQLGNSGRSNNFFQDVELENYLNESASKLHAVNPTEYRGSCFDRGHQVPSGDRTDTKENNQTTFLMSNMIPQTPYLNRVLWNHLESYTRSLVAKSGKKAYIISGPIYDEDFGNIGPNKDIPIPSKEFKVVIVMDANGSWDEPNSDTQIISVIMPNTLPNGAKQTVGNSTQNCRSTPVGLLDKTDWMKYQTTLSEVEKLSGFKLNFKKKGDL